MAQTLETKLKQNLPRNLLGPVGQKRNKRRIAALISPLSVVALLFALSLVTLPALATGHSPVAASATEMPLDSASQNEQTPDAVASTNDAAESAATDTPKPDNTPMLSNMLPTETPTVSETPSASTEPSPDSTETPNPEETQTPEPTTTPEPPKTVSFEGALDGVSVSVETSSDATEAIEATLKVLRIDAASDAEQYAHYQEMLIGIVPEEQLKLCTIYELEYNANGEQIRPPQSAADIQISDKKLFSAYASDSLQAVCLLDDSYAFEKGSTVTADAEQGNIQFSGKSCPQAIAVYGAPTSEPTATPELPVYLFEGDGLKISGSPAAADILPEGAVMTAERITSENDPQRYALYADMLQQRFGTELPVSFYAYDIGFEVDGQEVEPKGDVVNVTISDEAIPEVVEEPLVYHVINEESTDPALQEIAAEVSTTDGEAQVSFAAESFSTYILANGQQIVLSDSLTYKVIATEADTFTHTSYYLSRALGIAGNFHIVAFNNASLGAHTNGNVLAKSVSANSNFGTNGLVNELSYIQTYTQVNGVSASSTTHTLVVGSGNTITAMDNGNAFGINGTKLDKPKNLWQDQATATLPFIDLAAVKTSAKSRASSLAGNSNAYITSHLSTAAGSCTESYLTLSNVDKVGFYNITASALSGYSYFGVQGFQSGHSGTVIINVDCSGFSGTLTLPECRMYYGSGGSATSVNFAEVTNFVNGRILWNLVNCTANVTTRLLYASLLAPDASVTLGQNMNGTVIANNVTVSAESHRDDFMGEMSNGVTVTGTKVWTDFGTGAPANTSVTFQLYHSTDGGVTTTAYGSPVTLNATTGWSYNWTELPTGSLYTIVETTVLKGSTDVTASYAATYSTQTGVASGTITASNQYLYTLPETGGLGTAGIVRAGVLMGLLFTTLWIWNKRRTDSAERSNRLAR